jgi:putative phosphoesterase
MRTENHTTKPAAKRDSMSIGVLSDTHGHVGRPVIDIVRQTDLILHAGDLDSHEILQVLGETGSVIAVRGNMDFGAWSQELPREEFVEVGGILIYMIHDLHRISLNPQGADIRIVISGHTHRQAAVQKNGVLYLNPGSPSFPRGGHNASMALIEVNGDHFAYRHIAL